MDKQTRLCPECGKEGWLEVADTRTTPTPPAGQVEAVAEAIARASGWGCSFEQHDEISQKQILKEARAAIKASGVEHLPVLVNLIKYADGKCWPEVQAAIDAILPALPPELRRK